MQIHKGALFHHHQFVSPLFSSKKRCFAEASQVNNSILVQAFGIDYV
jgi:hypothetical protein